MNAGKLIVAIGLAVVIYLAILSIPDIKRYLKISSM